MPPEAVAEQTEKPEQPVAVLDETDPGSAELMGQKSEEAPTDAAPAEPTPEKPEAEKPEETPGPSDRDLLLTALDTVRQMRATPQPQQPQPQADPLAGVRDNFKAQFGEEGVKAIEPLIKALEEQQKTIKEVTAKAQAPAGPAPEYVAAVHAVIDGLKDADRYGANAMAASQAQRVARVELHEAAELIQVGAQRRGQHMPGDEALIRAHAILSGKPAPSKIAEQVKQRHAARSPTPKPAASGGKPSSGRAGYFDSPQSQGEDEERAKIIAKGDAYLASLKS